METKNLYVGQLGQIKITKGNAYSRTLEEQKDYIIFKIETYDEKNGIDIFTGKKYLIWSRVNFDYVCDLVGYKSIGQYEGIEKHMSNISRDISLDELRNIYYEINKNSEEKNYPKDLVLKCIYETFLLLNKKNIDANVKNQYIEELKQMASDYIKELTILSNRNQESNVAVSDKDLRTKYLNKIISFEDRIDHLAEINTSDLKQDLYELTKQMHI